MNKMKEAISVIASFIYILFISEKFKFNNKI